MLFLEDEGFDLGLTGFDGDALDAALGREGGVASPRDGIEDPPESGYREQYGCIVICDSETQQQQVYEELRKMGYSVKVVTT